MNILLVVLPVIVAQICEGGPVIQRMSHGVEYRLQVNNHQDRCAYRRAHEFVASLKQ